MHTDRAAEILTRDRLVDHVRLEDGQFVAGDVRSSSLYLTEAAAMSGAWKAKQENAADEYLQTHVAEDLTADVRFLFSIFEGYVLRALTSKLAAAARPVVLDVGCGISPRVPLYARRLAKVAQYVGLDPFDANRVRDYPFICSTIEETAALSDKLPTFDAFLFSTSLDHIEDLPSAASAIRKLARPGACAIFLIGLHDVQLVAEGTGAEVLQRVFAATGLARQVAMGIGWAVLRLPGFALRMRKRGLALQAGEPLDNLHFHYFTRANVESAIALFGSIDDRLDVMHTNACFLTTVVNGETRPDRA